MPVDRKINCSSGDRRGAEAGEISLFLCYTVYERKTQRLQGSAAQCKEHELSAPPFPQDKILFKHNFAGSVGVLKKKLKLFLCLFVVCARCCFSVSARQVKVAAACQSPDSSERQQVLLQVHCR